MTKWRPEEWKSPYQQELTDVSEYGWSNALREMQQAAYEEGADAMLKALTAAGDDETLITKLRRQDKWLSKISCGTVGQRKSDSALSETGLFLLTCGELLP